MIDLVDSKVLVWALRRTSIRLAITQDRYTIGYESVRIEEESHTNHIALSGLKRTWKIRPVSPNLGFSKRVTLVWLAKQPQDSGPRVTPIALALVNNLRIIALSAIASNLAFMTIPGEQYNHEGQCQP